MYVRQGLKTMMTLTEEEHHEIEGFIRRGKTSARQLTRAHILLKNAEGWSIRQLATAFSVSEATVSNIRKRFREGGVMAVLQDRIQQNRHHALSGAEEALLVAIACSPVPDGHDHWTVRMIQTRLVEMGVVDRIGRGTVHHLMKKMNLNPGSGSSGVSRTG
jgi:transposase